MDDEETYELVTVKRRNGGIISRGQFKGAEVLVKSQFRVRSGDYLISKRQVVHGANGIIPQELDGAIVSNEYLILHGNENFDINYLARLSETPRMYRYFFLSSYGIDVEKLVFNVPDWKKRKISIPQIEEQELIIRFFNQIDHLIALHSDKLQKLRTLKRAYLQQMFPREEERVPRIRFANFDGEWGQRKLGEAAEVVGGGTPDTSNPEYWDGDIHWYSPTEIGEEIYAFDSQRKISEFGLKNCSAKMLPADKSILFTSRAGIGDMAILKHPSATNQGFQSLVVNEDTDVYFIYSMGSKIKQYALKNASGSTFLEISGKGLSKMDVLIPTIAEQVAIGNFFKSIDRNIIAQQTKLDKLKQLKSAYLQKMFI